MNRRGSSSESYLLRIVGFCILVFGIVFECGAVTKKEEEASVEMLFSFDGAETVKPEAYSSRATIRPDHESDEKNAYLFWSIDRSDKSWVGLPVDLPDIRGYSALSFRMKADGLVAGKEMKVGFQRDDGTSLALYIDKIAEEWTAYRVPLGFMRKSESFAPEKVNQIRWTLFKHSSGTVLIDDVALVRGEEGDASWRTSREAKVSLEDPSLRFALDADFSRVEIMGKGKNRYLEWEISEPNSYTLLCITALPEDIRSFKSLRMNIKASRPVDKADFVARFSGAEDGFLSARLPELTQKWRKVEIPLAYFSPVDSPDPERLECLKLLTWNQEPVTIRIKHLELVKGRKGIKSWEPTKKDLLARIFGEDGVKKAMTFETDHFKVFTNTRAVKGKFMDCLEEHHDFIRENLLFPPLKEKVQIYLFRSKEDYTRFCVRTGGYTREQATLTAGHCNSSYFATYYKEPNSPTVVHELTHAMVYKTFGQYGGSWIHEGFAEYAEMLFKKRDVAKEFAVKLKQGQFTPLKEFLTIRSLAFKGSTKDASNVSNLYTQAAAFFAFMRKGPFAESFVDMANTITSRPRSSQKQIECLEKIYEMSLDEIQAKWVEWGKKIDRG